MFINNIKGIGENRRLIKKFLKIAKEDELIIGIGLSVLVMVLVTQYTLGQKYPDSFWTSLLPNFFADVISILVTTYLLTYLLEKREAHRKKSDAYNIINYRYRNLIIGLSIHYVHFMMKEPHKWSKEEQEQQQKRVNNTVKSIEQGIQSEGAISSQIFSLKSLKRNIENILVNIDNFVQEDFVQIPIKKTILAPGTYKSIFDSIQEIEVEYQQFCMEVKLDSLKDIDDFMKKYMVLLTPELASSLFKLEDLYNSGAFMTPLENRVQIVSQPKINVTDFKRIFSEIGTQLLFLIDYFNEYENVHIKEN